jgi:hypothetical protein
MEKISRAILSTIVALLFLGSCDKIKDAGSFDIEPTFTAVLDCKVPAILNVTNTAVFGANSGISPRSDAKVLIYERSIEGYEIKSITATVTSLSFPNIYLVSGDLIFGNFNREIKFKQKTELMTVGKTLTLTNDNDQINQLCKSLKDAQDIGVMLTGMADRSDVSFTIKIEVKTKASVKLL